MSSCQVLIGPRSDWREAIAAVADAPPLAMGDARALAFVHELSALLLRLPDARRHPDLLALGHWFRPVATDELLAPVRAGIRRLPRGLVLHYAPQNVDTVWAYAWLIALLCGNAGVVRMSERRGADAQRLLDEVAALLASGRHPAVAAATAVVCTPRDPEVNLALAARCHLRVVWGGDATVAALRAVPLPPDAHDLCFPDRFSLAVLGATAVAALDAAGLDALAEKIARDLAPYDQAACSSPRALAWIGAQADAARAALMPRLRERLAARGGCAGPALGVTRLTAVCTLAADGAEVGCVPDLRPPLAVTVPRLDPALRHGHPAGGLLYELRRDRLADLAGDLDRHDQTITHAGIPPAELAELAARLPAGAVSRIVPCGEALAFAPVWDGTDLRIAFTRALELR